MPAKKSPEKEERILNASIGLFAKNGYSQTTISQIAKASKVSFGTVFTYFDHKEALFRAAVLNRMQTWEPLFHQLNGHEDNSPLEVIKEMIENHIDLFAEQEEYLRLVQYVLGQPDRFREIFERLNDFLDRFLEVLKPIVQKGQESGQLQHIDLEVVCLSYFSFINGIRLMEIGTLDSSYWTKFKDQALRLFGPREEVG